MEQEDISSKINHINAISCIVKWTHEDNQVYSDIYVLLMCSQYARDILRYLEENDDSAILKECCRIDIEPFMKNLDIVFHWETCSCSNETIVEKLTQIQNIAKMRLWGIPEDELSLYDINPESGTCVNLESGKEIPSLRVSGEKEDVNELSLYAINPESGTCVNLESGKEIPSLRVSEEKEDVILCPSVFNTERERRYYARAIERGLMQHDGNGGYKWLYGGARGQVRLGYFLSKVYERPRPIGDLEKLFDVRKLDASITQASYDAKRADVIKWRAEIDTQIFLD